MADKNDVRVRIGGDNAGLATALKDSDRLVNQFARNATGGMRNFTAGIGASIKSALSFNAVLGTLAGTAGLGLLVKNAIDAASELLDTAQAIGVSTDALQELRHAASLTGVEQGKLDQSLRFLNKSLGETARGVGEAKDIFKTLGISVFDSEGRIKSADQTLGEIADAFGKLGSQAARTDAAMKLFGRGGTDLTNLLAGGSAGLEEMRKQAQDLGLVLDKNLIRVAEEAGDELATLGTVAATTAGSFLLKLAPSVRDLSKDMQGLLATVQKLGAGFGAAEVLSDEALSARIDVLRQIVEKSEAGLVNRTRRAMGDTSQTDAQRSLTEALDEQQRRLDAAAEASRKRDEDAVQSARAAAAARQKQIDDVIAGLKFEEAQLSRTTAEQKLYELAKKANIEVTDGFAAAALPLIRSIEAEKAAIKEAADSWKEYEDRVKSVWEKQRSRGMQIFEETRTEAEKYQATLTELNQLEEAGAISADTRARAVKKANDELLGSGMTLKDVFKDVNVSMSNAFADAILEGKKFGDVIDGLVKDIGRLIIQTALLNAVRQGASALGGLFGFGGDSAGGGGLTIDQGGTPGALIPSAKGNAFLGGRVIPFARGGILSDPIAFAMAGGNMGVAGEAGDEVIAPIGRDSQGRMGIRAVAANVTVNITAPPGTSARAEQRDDGRGGKTIDVLIDEAVAGNIGNQGSRTHRAMRSTFGVGTQTVAR